MQASSRPKGGSWRVAEASRPDRLDEETKRAGTVWIGSLPSGNLTITAMLVTNRLRRLAAGDTGRI